MDSMTLREQLKDKKRIVVKVGSSSLTHPETGHVDLIKLEKLVRELTDLHNRGKEVILVSSGAIAVGRKTIGMKERPTKLATKQACASIGQARLMMIYQKLFMEYNQIASQVLMTKNTLINGENRINARNTFEDAAEYGQQFRLSMRMTLFPPMRFSLVIMTRFPRLSQRWYRRIF